MLCFIFIVFRMENDMTNPLDQGTAMLIRCTGAAQRPPVHARRGARDVLCDTATGWL